MQNQLRFSNGHEASSEGVSLELRHPSTRVPAVVTLTPKYPVRNT